MIIITTTTGNFFINDKNYSLIEHDKDGCVVEVSYTFYFDNRRVRSRSIEVIPQDEDWSEIEMTIRSGMTDMTSVVEYVHELQHALKFCGIDKTIEL